MVLGRCQRGREADAGYGAQPIETRPGSRRRSHPRRRVLYAVQESTTSTGRFSRAHRPPFREQHPAVPRTVIGGAIRVHPAITRAELVRKSLFELASFERELVGEAFEHVAMDLRFGLRMSTPSVLPRFRGIASDSSSQRAISRPRSSTSSRRRTRISSISIDSVPSGYQSAHRRDVLGPLREKQPGTTSSSSSRAIDPGASAKSGAGRRGPLAKDLPDREALRVFCCPVRPP